MSVCVSLCMPQQPDNHCYTEKTSTSCDKLAVLSLSADFILKCFYFYVIYLFNFFCKTAFLLSLNSQLIFNIVSYFHRFTKQLKEQNSPQQEKLWTLRQTHHYPYCHTVWQYIQTPAEGSVGCIEPKCNKDQIFKLT